MFSPPPLRFVLSLLLSLSLCACLLVPQNREIAITLLPLTAPFDDPDLEYSALTWCGDKLLMVPQFPERHVTGGYAQFYTLSKSAILDAIDDPDTARLTPTPLPLKEGTIRSIPTKFEGYEAAICDDTQVWLTIEGVNKLGHHQAWLVRGHRTGTDHQESIELDDLSVVSLSSYSKIHNMSEEAIVKIGNDILSMHEINDVRLGSPSQAYRYAPHNRSLSTVAFPNLPYRITDSTTADQLGRFWVINYLYSGDDFSREGRDPLGAQYGIGKTHQINYNVERLVEFQYSDAGIQRVKRPPIQLKLEGREGRNWEGIARLDDLGFLLITDRYPTTLLGFVPYP
ncbi:hypothetical protein GCM10008090_20330 [Arenicella chitinivorans]|uniref:Uncharacterized protein n=1 Tax=Arenicella chitinivorans TaxID=1329800 RepID=A0A918RTJ1_9GAMM|nr:hypothetical protein [Arenicella chitinivorans]GHA10617.1 hypothetical protein GCM10008090_20330 [Arenicella chitinivorans]